MLHRNKRPSLPTLLKTHEKSAGVQMIGTIIVGSAAAFLASTAALDLVDGIVDRRRLMAVKPAQPRVAAPAVQAPAARNWEAPETLLKAA